MTSIKTIIVDDESRIRRRLERLVQACGEEWEIINLFSDGKEAFDEITNQSISFDLLITDVQMPEMDGLTLISELKKTHSFTSIIISGYDDFTYLQTAMREGAVNYILKPVDKHKFTEQLEEVKVKISAKRMEQQKWSEIHGKAQQLIYTKQIQLLSEITWNDAMDLSVIDWTKQFPDGVYQLLYVSVDQNISAVENLASTQNWDLKMEEMFKQISQEAAGEMDYWWWRSGKLQYWILICISDTNHFKVNQLVEQYKADIQKLTPFTISIGVANHFQEIKLLPSVKDQLLTLLQYRMIHGGNKVYHQNMLVDLTVNSQPKNVSSIIYKQVHQILSSLDGKGEDETVSAVHQLFKELESISSPAIIEDAVHYLCLQIFNKWMEIDGFGENAEMLSSALKVTKKAGNFTQLKDSIKHWVVDIKRKVDSRRKIDSDPILRAKKWIHENLGKHITIKEIAEHIYMSPTYFSNYFKAQTGETILDYITKCRLEKAKELLETTDTKVYDISSKLGYQDTKYFSRLFKQWYGQSPSQYREYHFKRD
ncbi:response regulator transcription factor [Metabacillus halosaccharovorans]|uniref:helix-turn-helix domain-containing protein n=1 Tax=Metabacillus halosaccharovorans TaxID=930124 RepID=UPI00403D5FD3